MTKEARKRERERGVQKNEENGEHFVKNDANWNVLTAQHNYSGVWFVCVCVFNSLFLPELA